MIKWFSVLKKNNIEIKLGEEPEEDEVAEETVAGETDIIEPVAKEEKQIIAEKADIKIKAKEQKEEAEAVEEKPEPKKTTKKAPDSTSGVADVPGKKPKAKKAKTE